MEKALSNIEKYVLFLGAILFPIFVLPNFTSPYIVPKEILGTLVVCLAIVVGLVRSINKGESKFSLGKFDLGITILVLSYIVSAIFRTPNKMEAFFFPGNVTFVIIAVLFYFLVNQLSRKFKNTLLLVLFTSGVLLSISMFLSQIGLFSKIPQLPAFMKDATFNPLGGNLQSIIYLLALLPIGVTEILKKKDMVRRLFFSVASVVIVLGAALTIVAILPGKAQAPVLPPMRTSWEVAIETLKQNPLLGAGPGNYITAFNLFRPVTYNQTSLWQIRFSSASSYYLSILTELGLVGLAAVAIVIASFTRKFVKDLKDESWEEISVAILFVALLFIPTSPSLIFLLMALLAVFSGSEEKRVTIASGKVPSTIVAVPIFLAIAVLAYFGTRAVSAEANYKKSLDALAANQAQATYNYMLKAEQLNPYVDRYHASLAQLEMVLANSYASKKDITDTDRSTIVQLVQQAIAEGKSTATLNLGRSANWDTLAQIYRNILAFADGADQFAIQSYNQAIALDPTNPNLRIALGGTYYALNRFSEAVEVFKLAVLTKPDLANAHYNLAIAYRENKDYGNAINEMQNVLKLVPEGSNDYTLAKQTLEDLQKKVTTEPSATESLTTPQENTPVIEPPIELPSEATPPAAP